MDKNHASGFFKQRLKQIQTTNLLAILAIAMYALFRTFQLSRIDSSTSQLPVVFAFAVLSCLLVFACYLFPLQLKHVAFWVPSSISLCSIASGLFTENGNPHAFTLIICATAIALMYNDKKGMFLFVGFINIILGFSMFVMGVKPLGVHSLFDANVTEWFVANVGMLFLCIVGVNISRQMQWAEESSKAFVTMMQVTPNLIALLDSKNRVFYLSNALAKMANIQTPYLAMGRPIIDLFFEPEMKLFIDDTLSYSGFYENTVEVMVNNKTKWYHVTSNRINAHMNSRFIEISDITPIMEAKSLAERSTRAKSYFLANMSHEIRTPMNAIIGMADLLNISPLTTQQKINVAHIKTASASLLKIINDVLDFTKIENNKMVLVEQEFDIITLFYDLFNLINIKVAQKGISLVIHISKDLPKTVVGDELRLKQVLINLLTNAVKFTDEGCVKLSATCEQQKNNMYRICFMIEDTGLGIKKEEIPKIFQEFEQADTKKNHNIVGTGLGLPISKRLVELMGGQLNISSNYQMGTTVCFDVLCSAGNTNSIAKVENSSEKQLLCYEPNFYGSKNIVDMCVDLGVAHQVCQTEDEFLHFLTTQNYTHIIFNCEEGLPIVKKHLSILKKAQLIALKDLNQTYIEDQMPSFVQTVVEPLLVTTLAELLNNQPIATVVETDDANQLGLFSTKNVRILVVDDNSVNLMVASELLKSYNILADCCPGGRQAIKKVQQNHYDMILMDHMMPEMDGIEATKAIRELGGIYARIPIVALSANAILGMRKKFLDAGMNDFISKPIAIKQLNHVLLNLLPVEKLERKTDEQTQNGKPNCELSFLLQDVKDLNVDFGLKAFNGVIDSYLLILRTFLASALQNIKQLQTFYQEGQWKEYGIEIHAFKGCLAQIGSMRLSELARKLEMAIYNKEHEYVTNNHETFATELKNFLTSLEEPLKRAEAIHNQLNEPLVATNTISHDGGALSLEKQLQTITEHLQALEQEKALELISQLQTFKLEPEQTRILSEIKKAITLFDYDLAEELIQTMENNLFVAFT